MSDKTETIDRRPLPGVTIRLRDGRTAKVYRWDRDGGIVAFAGQSLVILSARELQPDNRLKRWKNGREGER